VHGERVQAVLGRHAVDDGVEALAQVAHLLEQLQLQHVTGASE
jgi:hypothetical protein